MHILITGGTGFIGRALCRRLAREGNRLTVYSRRPQQVPQLCGPEVRGIGDWAELDAPNQVPIDAVINLAGEGIADRPWTLQRKQVLRASRINVTRALVDWIARCPQPPTVMLSGSAVGWYGGQGDSELTENAAPVADFAHELCRDWETEASRVSRSGVRLCIVRTGVVLDGDGGMLKKMLPPFRFGLGGRIGDGRQWLSWIQRDDLIELIIYLLHHPGLQGIFNATTPHPVTNGEFTRTLAAVLNRPALLPIPAPLLRLLLGEMAQLLLGGQRVLPQRAQASGFVFRYPFLVSALQQSLQH